MPVGVSNLHTHMQAQLRFSPLIPDLVTPNPWPCVRVGHAHSRCGSLPLLYVPDNDAGTAETLDLAELLDLRIYDF